MPEPNGRVRDQAERLRALQVDQSFIVQAPAGSGKTELLIQRFLTLLGVVEQPESIVAITFTRKAAGEMRHRVIDSLEKASGAEPQSPHELYTWKLARRALARDEELGWRLVEHPSRLRIQTIDSLSAGFVRQMPWVSRMGAPPRPEANVEHLYRRAVRDTLELLYSEDPGAEVLARLLAHLDNNVATVEELLAAMLARRDQWLRHVVGNAGSEGFRHALESALEQIVTDALEEIGRLLPENIVAETLALARFAARNLDKAEIQSPLAACVHLDSLPGTDAGSVQPWLGLAEMFLKRTGVRRKQLNTRQGFPAGRQGRDAKRRALAIPLDDLLVARLHGLRSLPPWTLDESQWEILGALMDLLPLAAARLKLVFEREGVVDFTEIAHAARTALGSSGSPTDLAFGLDCRLQHLLLDEFQDTSQSQYELLARLTEEWQPGDGRTLFLVGDPMQSIYGFREAEVALFMRARREGIGNLRPTPLKLSVNFRSNAGIVEWVNRGLGEAFPDAEDTFTGAVIHEPSFPFDSGGPTQAVFVHPFFDSDPEPEAERVLEIIRGSRSEHPDGTIAVLVRSRSHLFAIVPALRRAGERFQAVEIDALGERPVVQDLLALTRALLYPADRVAWLAILRAPWCGLTLADLDTLVGGDFSSAIWDLLSDDERVSGMSPDGRSRIGRVLKALKEAIVRRGTMNIRRWVEATWIQLGGPACLEDRTDLEDAAAYLDLLEESVSGANLRDEQKFAHDVTRLFARPDVEAPNVGEKGGLQLLTIHKAKGLEFDTVLLPGLGRYTRGEDRSLMMWLEYIDSHGETRLLLAPIKETGAGDDPLYGYLRRLQMTRRDHENTRLLYVAATRARKRLHLLGHTRIDTDAHRARVPPPRTLLGKIWDIVEREFERTLAFGGPATKVGNVLDAVETRGVPLRRLSRYWQAPPPSGDIDPPWHVTDSASYEEPADVSVHPAFEWAGELQRQVGIVVHAMLQRISVRNPGDRNRETIRRALASEGLDGERLDEASRRVELALEGTLSDEKGLWILSEHEDDRREYPLSGIVAGRVRRFLLDRTFVDRDIRWIIDYKTGTHEGGGVDSFLDKEQTRYRRQLENYANLMQHIDSRPIRLGLYFPLLQGWREWTFEPRPEATG